jgi:hypothetical protein
MSYQFARVCAKTGDLREETLSLIRSDVVRPIMVFAVTLGHEKRSVSARRAAVAVMGGATVRTSQKGGGGGGAGVASLDAAAASEREGVRQLVGRRGGPVHDIYTFRVNAFTHSSKLIGLPT